MTSRSFEAATAECELDVAPLTAVGTLRAQGLATDTKSMAISATALTTFVANPTDRTAGVTTAFEVGLECSRDRVGAVLVRERSFLPGNGNQGQLSGGRVPSNEHGHFPPHRNRCLVSELFKQVPHLHHLAEKPIVQESTKAPQRASCEPNGEHAHHQPNEEHKKARSDAKHAHNPLADRERPLAHRAPRSRANSPETELARPLSVEVCSIAVSVRLRAVPPCSLEDLSLDLMLIAFSVCMGEEVEMGRS